jgi:hypothetical protein
MSGQILELCNCDFLCPCWFDPTSEPDQGYCISAWTFDIQKGQSDGVDLADRKVVVALSIPNTLAQGNITARLYLDSASTAQQQTELEAIFGGQRGGVWETLAPLITKQLPTIKTDIDVHWGEHPKIKVGDHVEIASEPVRDPAGTPTRVAAAAVMTLTQIAEGQPAKPGRALWTDPDIGEWEPRSSMVLPFNWQA